MSVLRASAHIIAAVGPAGALSIPWAFAQLGWVAGPATMLLFSILTYGTSSILTDDCCVEDEPHHHQNYTYMDIVRSNLGKMPAKLCEWYQRLTHFGLTIACINIVSSVVFSMNVTNGSQESVRDSNKHCHQATFLDMTMFGMVEIIFSHVRFEYVSWLSSNVAALLSVVYPTIGLALGIVKVAGNRKLGGSINGVSIGTTSRADEIGSFLQALGAISFDFSFSMIVINIQDTLELSSDDNNTMKTATLISVIAITLFNMLCGCIGYASFGASAPKNILTGFGFYDPYWLLNIANAAMFIHLTIAYQVYCRPLFKFVEDRATHQWLQDYEFEVPVPRLRAYKLINPFRLVWRTTFVIMTMIIAMLFPFGDMVELLSVFGFWLFIVHYPVAIYINKNKLVAWRAKWLCLKALSGACFFVAAAAAAGSVIGLVYDLKNYELAVRH